MKITLLCVFATLISLTTFSQDNTVSDPKFLKHLKKEAIPDDILKEGHILVVQNPWYGIRGETKNDKENEAIKKLMDSIYKGKFIVLTQETFWGVKRDTSIYKYELDIEVGPGVNSNNGAYVEFVIVDIAKLMSTKDEKIQATAFMHTGIYCAKGRYLDKLELLIRYINEKG